MRRLVAAGLLPERAGQPVKAWVHISLADLLPLDGSSALLEKWTAGVRARWAGHRAAAVGRRQRRRRLAGRRRRRGARLRRGDRPRVTGGVNPAVLDDLVRLCVQLDRLRHHGQASRTEERAGTAGPARRRRHMGEGTGGEGTGGGQGRPAPDTTAGPGSARAGRHRQGRRSAIGPGRAGLVPAPPAARRPAGRAQPAAGCRLRRDDPGRDPQCRDPARPALPLGRAV